MKKKRSLLLENKSMFGVLLVMAILTVYVCTGSSNYNLKVINTALLNAMVAYGLSLMLGVGGQMVFSGTAFMGIAAYVTANLRTGRLGVTASGGMSILLSLLIVGVLSLVFGMLFMRLKGVFCVFATMGLVTICNSLFSFYVPLFGQPDGISKIQTLSVFGYDLKGYKPWFFALLAFVLLVAFIIERIRQSRFGRSLSAVRDDEIAAQTLGVNLYWTRVFAFVIASLFAGLSGSLFAMHNKFIFGNNFSFTQSVSILVMSMLGGINSTPGILIGALLVTFLPELLRSFSDMIMLFYGILVIVLMIFMPMGIGGLFEHLFKRIRRRMKRKAKAADDTTEGA